jgi:hypothetical protein
MVWYTAALTVCSQGGYRGNNHAWPARLVSGSEPVVLRSRSERAERADDLMAWTLGREDGLDEEMLDVSLAGGALDGLLDEQAYLCNNTITLYTR